ncbi:Helix-turn-helix [Salinihabitans flavidus]|uniref:Helix-turn-helix n=2 Tax=Salinihabitans flavidus TaxID=569882 RepID=A0A1H8VMM0_9RHOB|nr:Helix-turn-helix [Salinihabitans flavidus]
MTQQSLAKAIGVTRETINRIVTGKSEPGYDTIPGLQSVLKFSDNDFIWCRVGTKEKYRYEFFDQAAQRLGSIDKVIEITEAIYDQFPSVDDEANYGDPKKWRYFQRKFPEFGAVVWHEDKAVAYWFCLPVNDNIYDQLLAGENVNLSITPQDTPRITDGKTCLYFVDLMVLEAYQNKMPGKYLRESFLSFVLKKAKGGTLFHRIVANLTSEPAVSVAIGFGFHELGEHEVHLMKSDIEKNICPAKIYEMVLDPNIKDLKPFLYDPELKREFNKRWRSS